jgi:hypothetical protein
VVTRLATQQREVAGCTRLSLTSENRILEDAGNCIIGFRVYKYPKFGY